MRLLHRNHSQPLILTPFCQSSMELEGRLSVPKMEHCDRVRVPVMNIPVQKRRKWKEKKEVTGWSQEIKISSKQASVALGSAFWPWGSDLGVILPFSWKVSHILRLGCGFFLSKTFSLLFCSSWGCLFTLCYGGCLSSLGNYCISCRFVVTLGGSEFRLFLCDHLEPSLRHSLLSLWDRLQGSTDSSAVRLKTFKEATFELCVICHIYDCFKFFV